MQHKELTCLTNISIIIDMNKDYSRAIPETWCDIAAVFAALGDEHRQRILLTFEPGERLNVGQIAEVSTLARSTVSHHLKVLREAGVLQAEREGKEIYFHVNKAFLQEAFGKVAVYLDTCL
ncbi:MULTISPECIES: metalloregulator ArsR/SmtB family transcription factor [Zoogloea]|jgi:DNA-binding transcriptional ArsR family regulator|nr:MULTISPECIES: metalloregulator ArsR/SmtB family transcription factor [Zoogloea]MDD2668259.1 metalloregulator ArsR/SmtB family transcription factor [Zoogloea sp.]